MTRTSDAKFKEELTCDFKYDMRNLVNFHPTIRKSEIFFDGLFLSKVQKYSYKNTEELSFMGLNNDVKFK